MRRLVAAATAALVLAGCGGGGAAGIEPSGAWERLPDAPIGGREMATGVWTGSEVLVFGGSAAPPTHPSAGGDSTRAAALRDGAAFDPRGREWRRIAPAPVGIEPLSPVAVARGSVYVAVARNPGVRHTRMDLLAYRPGANRWDRLPSPPRRGYVLVSAGGRLLAAGPERGPVPLGVFLLGPREKRWRELPPAPFRGSLVWDGRRLVVITFVPAARHPDNPPWARAATLRIGDGAWRRLPDSDTVLSGYGPWVPVGGVLINPGLGDGGPRYEHGRPRGGILDPERGVWSELPNTEGLGDEFGGGVLTRTRLAGGSPGSLVLDLSRDSWLRVPRLWGNRATRQGWSSVNTRRGLLIFGGARWDRAHPDGQLLNHAWLWTPPPAR